MKQAPTGPIVVSLALIVAAGVYYALAMRDRAGATVSEDGFRLVVWDVGCEAGEADAARVAAALRGLRPTAVALVGLANADQADRIAAGLGGAWRVAAVPSDATGSRYLAILAAEGRGRIDQYLIDAGCSQAAIAFDFRDARSGRRRVVCCDAGGAQGACRRRYVRDVLAWCEAAGVGATLAVGDLGVGEAAVSSTDTNNGEAIARLLRTYARARTPDGADAGDCAVYVSRGAGPVNVSVAAAIESGCPRHQPVVVSQD